MEESGLNWHESGIEFRYRKEDKKDLKGTKESNVRKQKGDIREKEKHDRNNLFRKIM